MHPYIPHLLSDIVAAHRNAEYGEAPKPMSFEEEMEEVERYISEDPAHTLSYYCGLKKENFPPSEQLSDGDMRAVCQAFNTMLHTWNLSIDMPKELPAAFAYNLTIDTLNKKTMITNSGFVSFDYCTGYAPDCELKEYCPCLKYWKENE